MAKLTPEEIRSLLDYNPETGELKWKTRRSPKSGPGDIAGGYISGGYGGLAVEIDGHAYRAHNLAWACFYGRHPTGRIGHRDLDRKNNRIANLFEVGKVINQKDLTQERLVEMMEYDPQTGVFRWRLSRGGSAHRPPSCKKDGYIVIRVDGVLYRAHSLAWLYHHGRWPSGFLDHINGVRHDNRIANLREATPRQNVGNTKMNRRNTSGYRGVVFDKRRSVWRAQISIGNWCRSLGTFATKEEASEAYMAAARDHFGAFCPTPSQARATTEES